MIYHQAQRQYSYIVEFRQYRKNRIKDKSVLPVIENVETIDGSLIDVHTLSWGKFSFLILHITFLYAIRGRHHVDYLQVSLLACMARKAGSSATSLIIREKAPTEAIYLPERKYRTSTTMSIKKRKM
jgi:hypothetical protein